MTISKIDPMTNTVKRMNNVNRLGAKDGCAENLVFLAQRKTIVHGLSMVAKKPKTVIIMGIVISHQVNQTSVERMKTKKTE
jgi:hypothetical protein